MRERTYRFLPEYANEKKERIKSLSANFKDDGYIKGASDIAVKYIDKIVKSAHKGYITLDEAMREISEIELSEYAYLLRTLQYSKLPCVE